MLTYNEAHALFATTRDRYAGKPLANNTRLHRNGSDAYSVRLHGTDVVTIFPGDRYVLNTGGWYTVTTKDRINGYSPARVYSDGGWYVNLRPDPSDPEPDYPVSGFREVGPPITYKDWRGEERSYRATERVPLTREQRAARKLWREWRDRNRTPFCDGMIVGPDGYPDTDPLKEQRKAWLRENGLRPNRDGTVTLIKAVGPDFRSNHGALYKPRTNVVARDYKPTMDCGAGLHFAATCAGARRYHGGEVVYLRCRVDLDSLIPLGDKCKARSCYVVGRIRKTD